ncbi:hypothetical protein [Paraburkholderia humisilvae]|uniref:hypothetical protein n=1 Tax=Paraburkholderia humisilvae TaxID=627669 RepID=UPI001583AE82|nr:hypothetical protein [Paraburkholderia humisilvae]
MPAFEHWPEDEPVPLFLDVDADARALRNCRRLSRYRHRGDEASAGTVRPSELFPAPSRGSTVNGVLLGNIVREAFDATGFRAPDMSPRVLHDTYVRRQLLDGRSNVDVSRLPRLTSQRTVMRLCATIKHISSISRANFTLTDALVADIYRFGRTGKSQ